MQQLHIQKYLTRQEQLMRNYFKAFKIFDGHVLARRIYHEAPDDVFELIILKCTGNGAGSLNAFRFVNKRLKQVAESCATKLMTRMRPEDVNDEACRKESFPNDALLRRCKKIRHLISMGEGVKNLTSLSDCSDLINLTVILGSNLQSFEGCPNGIKDLFVGFGIELKSLAGLEGCVALQSIMFLAACSFSISDLSPLTNCKMMSKLHIRNSSITDISVLSSMPLLVDLRLKRERSGGGGGGGGVQNQNPSISDLSPLSHCTKLKLLDLSGQHDIEDLNPLLSLNSLEVLIVSCCQINSFAPLATSKSLHHLFCLGVPETTSFLPLASITSLGHLICSASRLNHPEIEELKASPLANIRIDFEHEEGGVVPDDEVEIE